MWHPAFENSTVINNACWCADKASFTLSRPVGTMCFFVCLEVFCILATKAVSALRSWNRKGQQSHKQKVTFQYQYHTRTIYFLLLLMSFLAIGEFCFPCLWCDPVVTSSWGASAAYRWISVWFFNLPRFAQWHNVRLGFLPKDTLSGKESALYWLLVLCFLAFPALTNCSCWCHAKALFWWWKL